MAAWGQKYLVLKWMWTWKSHSRSPSTCGDMCPNQDRKQLQLEVMGTAAHVEESWRLGNVYQIQPGCHLPWKSKNQSWKLQRDMGEAITVLSHAGMYQHMPGSLDLSCLPRWNGRTILILKEYLSLQGELEWYWMSPGIRVISKQVATQLLLT